MPSCHKEDVGNWEGLLKWEEKLKAGEWLFRGMQCDGWELKPSLERACETLYKNCHDCLIRAPRLEHILYREFRRRYQNYKVGIPEPVGIEWLSLMQHYGAPTRLLDFTYSFFIAAYFTMEKPCKKSCPHAIWAVRNNWVAKKGHKSLKHGGKDVRYLENEQNEFEWELQKDFFESLLNLRDPTTKEERIERSTRNPLCVFPVNGMRLNERSTIQRGVFLCTGNVTKSFKENLEKTLGENLEENLQNPSSFNEETTNLVKLVVPDRLRLEMLQKLHSMNINRASLFPGLQGFAESLGIYHPLAFGSGHPL